MKVSTPLDWKVRAKKDCTLAQPKILQMTFPMQIAVWNLLLSRPPIYESERATQLKPHFRFIGTITTVQNTEQVVYCFAQKNLCWP